MPCLLYTSSSRLGWVRMKANHSALSGYGMATTISFSIWKKTHRFPTCRARIYGGRLPNRFPIPVPVCFRIFLQSITVEISERSSANSISCMMPSTPGAALSRPTQLLMNWASSCSCAFILKNHPATKSRTGPVRASCSPKSTLPSM